jgi:hypothetical protein
VVEGLYVWGRKMVRARRCSWGLASLMGSTSQTHCQTPEPEPESCRGDGVTGAAYLQRLLLRAAAAACEGFGRAPPGRLGVPICGAGRVAVRGVLSSLCGVVCAGAACGR